MTIYTSYVMVMTGKKGWYYFAKEQNRTILFRFMIERRRNIYDKRQSNENEQRE